MLTAEKIIQQNISAYDKKPSKYQKQQALNDANAEGIVLGVKKELSEAPESVNL